DNGPDDINSREGIVLLGGGFFEVQENTITSAAFENANPDVTTIGIRARDTRHEDVIRKNYLSNLNYGNLANGSNTGIDIFNQDTGLRYLCNENSGNEYDFAVAGFFDLEEDLEATIKAEQIEYALLFDEIVVFPTGNILSDPNFSELQFDHRGSQNNDVNYLFYNEDLSQHLVEFNNMFTTPTNSGEIFDDLCPSEIITVEEMEEGIVNIVEDITHVTQELDKVTETYNTAKYLYTSLIDGGDTEALKDEVEFSWSDEVWVMRDKLLNMSPNVSTKVAYEVADKTDVFPHPVALDIFLANPHLSKDHRFLKYLKSKANPMPEYMIDLILNTNSEESLRKELEQQITSAKSVKLASETRLVHLLQAQGADREAIYNVINGMNTTTSDMLMVEYALDKGNIGAAQDKLALLQERMFEKDPMIKEELEQYANWFDLREAMATENRTLDQMTSSERKQLEEIAFDYFYTIAGKKALAYLEFRENGWFVPPAFEKDQVFSFQSEKSTNEGGSQNFKATIFPNPATDVLYIELDNKLVADGSSLQFDVYNSHGQLIYQNLINSDNQL
ncbi:MAG: hypothetical protein AAF193_06930, partial [Bacteroidota bacterium]